MERHAALQLHVRGVQQWYLTQVANQQHQQQAAAAAARLLSDHAKPEAA